MYKEGNNYSVYCHQCSVNLKKYIGITGRKNLKHRFLNGKGYQHNIRFSNAINKYGWDSFITTVLDSNLTRDQARELEIYYIAKYDTTNPEKGYNVSPGGNLVNEITRKQISKTLTGRKMPDDQKERLRAKLKNVPHYWVPSSAGIKGFDNKRSKHVICIETQEIYGSLHEAATKTGFDRKSLQQACEGKAKYVHGYHFAFWPIDIRPKEELNIKKAIRCIELNVVYRNVKEAAKAFNLCESTIQKTCAHKYKASKGFHFLIEEEYQKVAINKSTKEIIEYCDSFKPKKIRKKPENKKTKKIICINTGKIYNSATEVRDDLGICISSISSVCTGKYKSAGRNLKEKYVFKYFTI